MATIVAVCPYCRAGGVRAPASAVGASATCPKCGSSFTVLPSEGVPGWAKPTETKPGVAPPSAETQPSASLPDVTEPSPVVSSDEKSELEAKPKPRKPKPAPAPVAAPPEPEEPAEATDVALVFALAALALVGPAVLATLFPYGRFVAAGLAGVGLLAAVAALFAEGRARLVGGGAAALHFGLLVVVFLAPSWLNLDPWLGAKEEGPRGPFAVAHGSGERKPVSPADWIDANTNSWENGDARLTVGPAAVGPLELRGPKDARKNTKEQYLELVVRVANIGVEREILLPPWATGQGADGLRVTDPAGKPLQAAAFDAGWTPDRGKPGTRAMPGVSTELRFHFVAPPPKTEFIRVTLGGEPFGVQDEIKFRVNLINAAPRPRQ
jgi:hypothetical protein